MIYKTDAKDKKDPSVDLQRYAEEHIMCWIMSILVVRKARGENVGSICFFVCRRVMENKNPTIGCDDICTMEISPKVLWNPLVNTIPAFGGLAECYVQGDNTDCRIFICTNFYIQKKCAMFSALFKCINANTDESSILTFQARVLLLPFPRLPQMLSRMFRFSYGCV